MKTFIVRSLDRYEVEAMRRWEEEMNGKLVKVLDGRLSWIRGVFGRVNSPGLSSLYR